MFAKHPWKKYVLIQEKEWSHTAGGYQLLAEPMGSFWGSVQSVAASLSQEIYRRKFFLLTLGVC